MRRLEMRPWVRSEKHGASVVHIGLSDLTNRQDEYIHKDDSISSLFCLRVLADGFARG